MNSDDMQAEQKDPWDAMEYAGAFALAVSIALTVAVALWTAAQIYGCPL